MLVVALLEGAKPFYYDSGAYWALGSAFIKDSTFSLLNFDDATRGYLLPLINRGLAVVVYEFGWNASVLVKIFNALVFALISTVLAPRLAELAWPDHSWGLWRRLAVAVLLLVFWRSYLNFPLSDFPALAAALVAIVAVGRPHVPGWMLAAGVASAAAINMRPAYVVVIPVVLGLVALDWWKQRDASQTSLGHRLFCVLLLLIGFAAVSLPQSLATHRHHERWTFVPGVAGGLSSLQFTEGMRLQRYETFVGTGQTGPSMRYEDRTGQRILEQRGDATINDAGEYLGLVADHPVDMTTLSLRHVVNGLDQRYATPYVETLDTDSLSWLRLFGFLLVFLAVVRVAWPAARHGFGFTRWRYLVGLLLCASPCLASAVETRFLLPACLLVYLTVLAPGSPLPSPPGRLLGSRLGVAGALVISFVLYMSIVLYVVDNATDQLRFA